MPIQISTTMAVIDWNVSKANLSQIGNGAQILDLNIQKPLLEMQTNLPKVLIDQSQPFSEAGLKGIKAFMKDAVSLGRQIVSDGIERIVSQGNDFINIHTGVDPIPDQALYNAYDMFEKSFNYGVIPQSRPSVSLQEGRVNTTFNPGSVNNQSAPQKVQMDYTPWQINYFMKQYNSITYSMQPSNFKFTV